MLYCEYPSVQDMRVNHGLAKIFAAEEFLDIPKIVAPDIERVENACIIVKYQHISPYEWYS